MSRGGPLEVLQDFVDQGVIEHIGISGGPIGMLIRYMETGAFTAVETHNRYTLLNRSADRLLDVAQRLGIAVVNAAPYGSGMLAKGPDAYARYAYQDAPASMIERVRQIASVCAEYDVPLPAGAFLQAAAEGQQVLTDFVLTHTKGAQKIADLFCGIGTYSLPASRHASVAAFELEGASVATLRETAKKNALKLTATARDLFKNPLAIKELAGFDAVILNPPRAGAKTQTEAIAASTVKKLVMISCNPASFARDAKTLKSAGFTLSHALGLDQFVWSPHLEICAAFER
jgi:tRNA/tmRNA/rRNA uracil-C5-methylase (TrmA/RlmC/RlmD family)